MADPALSFGFTKLVVADLERAVRFYGAVFGMRGLHRVRAEDHAYPLEEEVMALADDPGAHRLVLVQYLEMAPPPAGAAWTGFAVPDIRETLAALEREGGRIAVAVHENAEHGVLAALAADPEGHMIEVIQAIGGG